MNVGTYIENQIAELEAELSDKRVELASCIQPADWTAFSTSAAKKLDKAYESFCSAIRRRVTWGVVWRHIFNPAGISHPNVLSQARSFPPRCRR